MTAKDVLSSLPSHMSDDSSTNNYKFIYSFQATLNTILESITNLKLTIQIDTATGLALEDIGALFGVIRSSNENDENLRARIKSYFQSVLLAGTFEGLQKSLSNAFDLDEEDIEVEEPRANVFTITINVEVDTDLESLNNTKSIVETGKAAGMYFKKFDVGSSDNGFLINISKINGEDKLY